jgi:uncharacterized membrane protein YfcA
MFDLSQVYWVLAIISGFLVGFAKTGVVGTGVLAVPFFAVIFPAGASVGILLPLLCAADIIAVTYYRQHTRWQLLWPLFPWVILGIVSADLVASRISDDVLQRIIGGIVISMLILAQYYRSKEFNWEGSGRIFRALLGILCGLATMLANAAGPIMTIYLLTSKLPKQSFIGTGAWFFMIVNLFKLPFMARRGIITVESLFFDVKLLPAILAGGLLGIIIVKHMNEDFFRNSVSILAGIAALKLLIS